MEVEAMLEVFGYIWLISLKLLCKHIQLNHLWIATFSPTMTKQLVKKGPKTVADLL